MSFIPYNVYLTYAADPDNPATQILTLNALSNGYYSPPSNGNGNPPMVMATVDIPCTNTAILQSDGLVESSGMGYYYAYGNAVSYNLPDGSLLSFEFYISYDAMMNLTVALPVIPKTSSGSQYAVSYNDGDYQSSLNLTLYLNA